MFYFFADTLKSEGSRVFEVAIFQLLSSVDHPEEKFMSER
jgi:hypothetical protein